MGVCRELKKADIPCRVEQIPNKHYHILVSPNALDLARKAANLESIDKTSDTIPSSDADEEEVFDPTAELLDAGVPLTAESRRRDTYLDPWYPEDATVAVWSQDVDDLSSIIELSLDANHIHWRCDSEERGAKKIFVRPEDEPFARELSGKSSKVLLSRSARRSPKLVLASQVSDFACWGLREMLGKFAVNHCNLAYSDLACFRMGMSGSASFQRVRKSSYAAFALAVSPDMT